MEVSRVQFIPPALAKLRSSPPTGDAWQFEVKFDGYRVQLHKAGASSTLFGSNGVLRFCDSFPGANALLAECAPRA